MMYQNIQPPFTLKFREMSEKDLKDYNQWFLSSISARINVLSVAVKSTQGFEEWQPDYSEISLGALGQWFAGQVETRELSKQEIQEILDEQKLFKVGTQDWTLTIKTRSLIFDVGMYLSQVLLKNHSSLRWDQQFLKVRGKKFIDYGQPVLVGFGAVACNPIRLTDVLAYSLADGGATGSRLRQLYDIWSAKIIAK
jgi:hypothetical protein